MSFIASALCVPSPEIEALMRGRAIAVLSRQFLQTNRVFALYPLKALPVEIPLENYYRSGFIPTARSQWDAEDPETAWIRLWAKCEFCQSLNGLEDLESFLEFLGSQTIWTSAGLGEIVEGKNNYFLTCLRVYKLPQAIVCQREDSNLVPGKFIGIPQNFNGDESQPVLSDRLFYRRREQLEKRQPPDHPELELLQSAIAEILPENANAQGFDRDLQVFLGWGESTTTTPGDRDRDWIEAIATVGNSSDGDTFEKLVRKSLIKLGFSNRNINPKTSLHPDSTGGAGGLDFYCENPYPVVGECKATQGEKVPDGTPAQLVKLGYKHLQRQYNRCIKIIMAAGELTEDAELTASGNEMNVIRPETLQRLVDLKSRHPGAIDLLDLKPHLEQEPHGQEADGKVNRYIDRLWQDLQVRSHLIKLVKNANRDVGIEYLNGAYDASNPPKLLGSLNELHEVLIELSSPLTGYLGRKKGETWQGDRFYFLRDLDL
ncbi:MAG: DUF1802 family protein [Cyanobacteria bacterium J007]|nr:MAG: DUF1802 family protein [Cyanobacteria bacterium J007]